MPTYSLLTVTGKNKEAAALANGTPLTITHIAFGDGDYAPTGGEVALQNEIGRKPVQASGTVNGAPNTAFFETLLEAEDGPYTIHEGSLIDDAGDMIAIIKYDPPINKPIPASGQTVEALLRTHVVFSDLENLVLKIDSINAFVAAERKIDTGDGLKGGGDLSQDRTHTLDFDGLASIAAANIHVADDHFALFDKSAGIHKKISTSGMAALLGQTELTTHEQVVALLNAVSLEFASEPETVAGVLDDKPTHPKGVMAAIDAATKNSRALNYFIGQF